MSEADDTPLWVEVLDVVLAPALCIRTLLHLLVADGIAEIDADLPDNDVTLQSPVVELRGTEFELGAHALTFVAGIALWAFSPLQMPTGQMQLTHAAVLAWSMVQCFVLMADPFALGLSQLQSNKTMSDQPVSTDGGTER